MHRDEGLSVFVGDACADFALHVVVPQCCVNIDCGLVAVRRGGDCLRKLSRLFLTLYSSGCDRFARFFGSMRF